MEENNEKQIKINVPAGYVIDKENSTFECIKLKKKKRFADYDGSYNIDGFYIRSSEIHRLDQNIDCADNNQWNKDVFTTLGAAKSALAFAQIGQIRKNEIDIYGRIPSWNENSGVFRIFFNLDHNIDIVYARNPCTELDSYLSFVEHEYAYKFIEENRQLLKDYFMTK